MFYMKLSYITAYACAIVHAIELYLNDHITAKFLNRKNLWIESRKQNIRDNARLCKHTHATDDGLQWR